MRGRQAVAFCRQRGIAVPGGLPRVATAGSTDAEPPRGDPCAHIHSVMQTHARTHTEHTCSLRASIFVATLHTKRTHTHTHT